MMYFAYGSNMDSKRMLERGIKFKSRRLGILNGYSLIFNKKASKGDFGYANISLSEGDFVEGILYEVGEEDIKKLDKYEGYPNHYDRDYITVFSNKIPIESIVYIANPNKIMDGLLPTSEYLSHLLEGKEFLSKEYYNKIITIITK